MINIKRNCHKEFGKYFGNYAIIAKVCVSYHKCLSSNSFADICMDRIII